MTRILKCHTCVGMNFANPLQLAVLFAAILLAASPASGQVATGIPPFSSMAPSTFDSVNEANGNVFFSIPIVNKGGRGMPFNFALAYNNTVWIPYNLSYHHVWTPAGSWGWAQTSSASTGYVSYSFQQGQCYDDDTTHWYMWNIYTYNSYTDPNGASHDLGGTVVSGWDSSWPCGSGPPDSATINVSDGSGYTVLVNDFPSVTIYSRSGIQMVPWIINQDGYGNIYDPNGNHMTVTGSPSSLTFTDTLGATAMTAGANAASNTYTYTDPSGNPASYTVWYSQYYVRTNFGCSGIAEYGPSTQTLVDSIFLPDGTYYAFYYGEQTPDYPGYITGRLTKVKLPTGGTITYAYSGGDNNTGITCADGSTPTLTRTLDPGGGGAQEAWTYSHTENYPDWTATVTDPAGNETDLNFAYGYGAAFGQSFETRRKAYQGSSSQGNLLETLDTCYNGSSMPCLSTVVYLPISSRTAQTTLPNPSSPSKTSTAYNSYGLPTEVDEYNFGSSTPVRKTLTSISFH